LFGLEKLLDREGGDTQEEPPSSRVCVICCGDCGEGEEDGHHHSVG
jgi:hypothetical protein